MIRCTGCNHSFGTTTLYNSHECIPPGHIGPFMCQYCMYQYNSLPELHAHVCPSQQQVVMHTCRQCNTSFPSSSLLKYHACSGDFEPPNLQLHLDKNREKQYQEQLQLALSASLDQVNAPQQRLVEFDVELDELARVMQMSVESFQGEEAALRQSAIDAGLIPDGFELMWYVCDELVQMGVDWKVLRLVSKQWRGIVDRRRK